jgi:uncharacterized oxidoreductase
MKTTGNTILITGGSTGIGFALASSFSNRGNEVIICARHEEKLHHAKEKLPNIEIRKCDVSKTEEADALVKWLTESYPEINMLVNNAGIQRGISLKNGVQEAAKWEEEIAINFSSQVYLSADFVPLFLNRASAILNVSSGLAFVPIARFPIYCATKAAIHSFTMSLRAQLKDTSIKVFEVIPPTVYDTELKGKPLEKTDWAVSSAEVAEAVIAGLEKDQYEIPAGSAANWLRASKSELDQAFENINRW